MLGGWRCAIFAIANQTCMENQGQKKRRVIQNKMHHLKLLSREDYLEMLSTMGIQTTNP